MEGKPPAHRGEPQRLSVRMGKADKEKGRFGEMAGSCIFDSLTARSWKSTRKNNGNSELHFIIERTPFPWGGVRGVTHGVKGVSRGVTGWGRKLPRGVNGVKNSGGG